MTRKLDTRAVGLDVGMEFVRWLTGAENLHYGLWTGLDVSAGNLRAAQDAYTAKLFALLPEGQLRILDVGGGAGETAGKLCALGHAVDIVVPSPALAARCRENAKGAEVFQTTYEAFEAAEATYDVILFSESFQYIPVEVSLPKSLAFLRPGGHVLLADCFRSDAFQRGYLHQPGGGHRLTAFRETLADSGFQVISEEDITEAVAPSIDLEQGLYNAFGCSITRIDTELHGKRPMVRWLVNRIYRLSLSQRRRDRLYQRLMEQTRTSEAFNKYNRYLMMKLRKAE
ncbi:MAG: methyltransferase domain-containing protein [Pseudomonadota bacterium]